MTVAEAITILRGRLDDNAPPYKWLDSDLISYLNWRINSFAQRTGYYRDTNTTAVTNISVSASTADYALDSRIIKIRRVRGTWDTVPLTRRSVAYMDENCPGWDDTNAGTGTPYVWIPDHQVGYISLWPVPSSSGTLYLTVERLPAAQLTTANITALPAVTIEFPVMWQEDLVNGALASCYAKRMNETYHPAKVAEYEGRWQAFLLDCVRHQTETLQSDEAQPDYYSIYGDIGD